MQLVRYELRNSTAILTLERPEKRNALSRELIAALAKTIEHAANDPDARCVILTGHGPAFCAGMDLDELRGTVENAEEVELVWEDAQALSDVFQRLYTLPKPTIAAVNGAAVAGGAGLVTVCDLALAVPSVNFGYPEVRRGLVAAMVLPHLLRHVGERAARKMLLTGELIDAAEAERIGLVNAVVEPQELLPTALRWAASCAEGGPIALATTKALLERCSKQSLSVEELADASAEPRLNEECHAGVKAFFSKEKAPWVPK